ncbi:MAG: hypothetical protein GSR75_01530 [Desulfurococcales archaeon]|nr:hypothetical protein [Desulfurococcales archaeon]
MKFQIYLTRRADRELKRLPPDVKERIEENSSTFSSDLLPKVVVRLAG